MSRRQPSPAEQQAAEERGSQDLERVAVLLKSLLLGLQQSNECECECIWRGLEEAHMQSAVHAVEWLTADRPDGGKMPSSGFVVREVAAVLETYKRLALIVEHTPPRALERALAGAGRYLRAEASA